jgi:hypothetical protein
MTPSVPRLPMQRGAMRIVEPAHRPEGLMASQDVANRRVRRAVPMPCLALDETSLLTRRHSLVLMTSPATDVIGSA